MDELITVIRNGERIAVHPDCLAAHLRLGWREDATAELADAAHGDGELTQTAQRRRRKPAAADAAETPEEA